MPTDDQARSAAQEDEARTDDGLQEQADAVREMEERNGEVWDELDRKDRTAARRCLTHDWPGMPGCAACEAAALDALRASGLKRQTSTVRALLDALRDTARFFWRYPDRMIALVFHHYFGDPDRAKRLAEEMREADRDR